MPRKGVVSKGIGVMLKIFIGYDERQPISFTVLAQSIIANATKPISISPLVLSTLPIERRGLTPFTWSRFLVPYLCDYKGWALFMDVDMIVQDDISKIFDFADESKAIHVSKNVERFEWASLMLFNCEKCKMLTPEVVETAKKLHTIDWVEEGLIGDIPTDWNHLVGYDKPRDDAKLVHFTQGVPAYPETNTCEYSDAWRDHLHRAIASMPWAALMGPSVHAIHLQRRDGSRVPVPKYMFDFEKQELKAEYMEKVQELIGDIENGPRRESNRESSIIAMP